MLIALCTIGIMICQVFGAVLIAKALRVEISLTPRPENAKLHLTESTDYGGLV